jgi:hypothetical protein
MPAAGQQLPAAEIEVADETVEYFVTQSRLHRLVFFLTAKELRQHSRTLLSFLQARSEMKGLFGLALEERELLATYDACKQLLFLLFLFFAASVFLCRMLL